VFEKHQGNTNQQRDDEDDGSPHPGDVETVASVTTEHTRSGNTPTPVPPSSVASRHHRRTYTRESDFAFLDEEAGGVRNDPVGSAASLNDASKHSIMTNISYVVFNKAKSERSARTSAESEAQAGLTRETTL
jgi:hypothetical protein